MGQKWGVFNPVSRQISETITVYSNKKIQFRDTGIFIQSSADGKLLISSDGSGADDITLTGNVTITNDLTISGAFSYGAVTATSLNVTGATTLDGNVDLGDAKADTITVYGDVVADGTENPEFDYSASTAFFKSSTGEVTLGGNVTILGSKTFITGTGDITLKGNVSIDANKTFDMSGGSGTFATGTGNVTLGGNVTISGSKTLDTGTGLTTIKGTLECEGNRIDDAGGASTIAFDGAGNTTINGNLVVSGTFEIGDGSVTGDFDIQGENLQATTGTLNISKPASMTTILGTFNVDEAATFDTTLGVTGAASFDANVTLGNQKADDIKFSGDIIGDGVTNADFDLSASSGTFLTPTGNITIGGTTTISGTTRLNFQDSGTYLYSSADGTLDLVSDTIQNITCPTINLVASSAILLDGDTTINAAHTFGTGTGAVALNGSVILATTKTFTSGTGSAIGGVFTVYRDGSGNSAFTLTPGSSLVIGENTSFSGAETFGTGTGAVSINGDTVLATAKTFTSGTGSAIGGIFTIYSDGSGNKSVDITPGTSIILGDNMSFAGTETFTSGTGLTTISGDYTLTGHFQAQEFTANAFNFPAPASEWSPILAGAFFAASLTTKKCWIPLNFLKIGDEIVSYKIVGDVTESNAATLDCKLVRINLANPLTTTDVTGGGIVQVDADGNFDVEATLSAVETVATDKQYALELLGTTGVADTITVIGAEVKVNRKT